MQQSRDNLSGIRVILGLSGGVDSAVAALLLKQRGARVEALHMTNWDDEDGYCTAAEDLQDARRVCEQLDIPLHHVNFAPEYRDRVFRYFLQEYRDGRTPNPDVLCNREIKFGVFRDYARRLGGQRLATGHYARVVCGHASVELHKGIDPDKDQSYFLHAVSSDALRDTIFPLGELRKSEVRRLARDRGLATQDKKDSTGICFIGERPFREFLAGYLPAKPGDMRTPEGNRVGAHQGLMYYTLGQRQGLGIGGRKDGTESAWYVAGKDMETNTLLVVQGEHPMLYSGGAEVTQINWIGKPPDPPQLRAGLDCAVKLRYRQEDQRCRLRLGADQRLHAAFASPQRAVAPGQYAVFYAGERCLGGGVIDTAEPTAEDLLEAG